MASNCCTGLFGADSSWLAAATLLRVSYVDLTIIDFKSLDRSLFILLWDWFRMHCREKLWTGLILVLNTRLIVFWGFLERKAVFSLILSGMVGPILVSWLALIVRH